LTSIGISGVGQLIEQEKIHNLCLSDDPRDRIEGLSQLKSSFALLPETQQAWNDLHRLITDEDSNVRWWAVNTIDSAFAYLPYKPEAWNDLIKLTDDKTDIPQMSSRK